ncbi:hypothetical protein ACOSP7_004726 [Xanthoceras sorbifolium]
MGGLLRSGVFGAAWLRACSPSRSSSKNSSSAKTPRSRRQTSSNGMGSNIPNLHSSATQNLTKQEVNVGTVGAAPVGVEVELSSLKKQSMVLKGVPRVESHGPKIVSTPEFNSMMTNLHVFCSPGYWLRLSSSVMVAGFYGVIQDTRAIRGASSGVVKQSSCDEDTGTRKKGWKRQARSSVVIIEDVQDSFQLGKRESVFVGDGYQQLSFMDFLLMARAQLLLEELESFCMTLWYLWHKRNRLVHGKQLLNVAKVVDWSRSFLLEFQAAAVQPSTAAAQDKKAGYWSVVGVGVIIRDHQGLVCTFSAQKIQAHFTPQLADTVALLLGIRFAADSYLIPASLKCDAAAVVSCVNAGSSLGSEFEDPSRSPIALLGLARAMDKT